LKRRRPLPLLAIALLLCSTIAAPVRAATDCVDVPGIGAEIAKFLDEVSVAQAAGQGTLPLMDVLFGVTAIDDGDQKALDKREPVQVTKTDDEGGTYSNRGPKHITVEGIFAAEGTLFRIPKLVTGRYVLARKGATLDGVTLNYDSAHTVELGTRIMGIRFFKPIHHTVITRAGLAFFLDTNAGPDPDRCYRAVGG
jgi:hypothetical protein